MYRQAETHRKRDRPTEGERDRLTSRLAETDRQREKETD